MNWSKLSEVLTGDKFKIRGEHRDPIPKKYFNALTDLKKILEEWQIKWTKEKC